MILANYQIPMIFSRPQRNAHALDVLIRMDHGGGKSDENDKAEAV